MVLETKENLRFPFDPSLFLTMVSFREGQSFPYDPLPLKILLVWDYKGTTSSLKGS